MQINLEDLLEELLRFDRRTSNKMKVEMMTRVVATTIRTMSDTRSTPSEVLQSLLGAMEGRGHA